MLYSVDNSQPRLESDRAEEDTGSSKVREKTQEEKANRVGEGL